MRCFRYIHVIIVVGLITISHSGCSDVNQESSPQDEQAKQTAADSFQETMDKVELEDRHIREGNRLMELGNYQTAIDEYMNLKKYGGLYWRLAHYKIASCYSSLGKHDEALEFFQRWYDSAADWAQQKYKSEYNQYRQKAGLPSVD